MDVYELEIFFDGACPLCRREIDLVRRFDRRRRVKYTDIAAPGFDDGALEVSWDELMAKIYARLPDGTWIHGVEVFRRLYTAIGLGWLVAMTRVPGISHLLEIAYAKFAKNRLRWTGRCDAAACELPTGRPARPRAAASPT